MKFVSTYLVLTFLFSLVFYVIMIRAGTVMVGGGLGTYGLMWCPGIAALITTWIYQRNFKELGWSLGKLSYLVLGFTLPLAYAALAYGIVWLTGLGTFTTDKLPPGMSAISYFMTAIKKGLVITFIIALGEEVGWRGLLVNQLVKMTTFSKTVLISGVIWAVWHFPLTLWADYNSGTPAWYGLGCFTVMVLGISFPMAWLRIKSRSVWPAALFHASHDLFIQRFFDPLTGNTGITRYIIGEFGAALALAGLIVGLFFWHLQRAAGKKWVV